MSNLGRVFALTKSEQRVVILIVVLLVAFAFAKRRFEHRNSIPPPAKSTQPSDVVRPEESKPADGD